MALRRIGTLDGCQTNGRGVIEAPRAQVRKKRKESSMPQYSTTRADVAALWTEKQPAITEYLAHNLARSPDDPRVAELAEEVFRRALDTITRKALTDDGKMCSTFFNQARLAVAREKKARSTGTRPLRPRLTVDEADALVSQAFETHYPTLVRFVTAQIANPEQAEEIASDAFLDLRESLLNGRLDTTLPMAPWLYRSAKNRVANVRRAAVSIPLSWDVPDRDASHDPLTVLTRQETRRQFERRWLPCPRRCGRWCCCWPRGCA